MLSLELLPKVAEEVGWTDYRVITGFKGRDLEEAVCRHPFIDRDSIVICGEHVT